MEKLSPEYALRKKQEREQRELEKKKREQEKYDKKVRNISLSVAKRIQSKLEKKIEKGEISHDEGLIEVSARLEKEGSRKPRDYMLSLIEIKTQEIIEFIMERMRGTLSSNTFYNLREDIIKEKLTKHYSPHGWEVEFVRKWKYTEHSVLRREEFYGRGITVKLPRKDKK